MLGSATMAHAQPICLPDANGDGQPRFGHTAVRIAPEVFDGWDVNNGSKGSTTAAFGDLDGDGTIDAVVGDVYATHPTFGQHGFISNLWGDGDGIFRPGPIIGVGNGPCFVEVFDFNADGALDIIVCEEHDDTISILFNMGGGVFAPRTTHPVGDSPRSLAVRDFDGDGDGDILILNTISKDVSFLRNTGDGLFEPQVRYAVPGITPRGFGGVTSTIPGPFLAVADLDHDGDIDAAIPCGSKIRFLVNDRNGVFSVSSTTVGAAIPNAYALAIADLDGNGWEDIASTSFHGVGPECLFTYAAIGPLLFAPEVAHDANWSASPTAIQWASSLDAGDADGDGDADLAVAQYFGDDIILLRNTGNGALGPKEWIGVREDSWFLRFTDADGDGREEMASISRYARSTLSLLMPDGAGGFLSFTRYPTIQGKCCQNWSSLTAGDLDLDGDIDLVSTHDNGEYNIHVKTLFNDGAGGFDEIVDYSLGPIGTVSGSNAAIGDLDGDGWLDLVIADTILPGGLDEPGRIWTMINKKDGNFDVGQYIAVLDSFPINIAMGDLDDDGDIDAAAWTCAVYPGDNTPVKREIAVFINDGSGELGFTHSYILSMHPWFPKGGLALVDADQDGHLDIVATTTSSKVTDGRMHLLRGVGDGSFHSHTSIPLWKMPEGIGMVSSSQPTVAVVHNRNFPNDLANPMLVIVSLWPELRVVRSMHDDRALTAGSIAMAMDPYAAHVALPSAADGLTLQTRIDAGGNGLPFAGFANEGAPTSVAIADFDNDGEVDMAVAVGPPADCVNIFLARPCPACIPDCDEDGDLDVMDYLCFLDRFAAHDPRADTEHDGDWDLFDLLAYQGLYAAGCD